MPRKPRIEFQGAFYHVICRGNNKQEIFAGDNDYREFLKGIKITKARYGFLLYCYNLIPNHLHLAVETSNEPLSRIMCSLLTRYARYFNSRHKRTGHVFEKRYKAILCQKESYLLEMLRYIHLNDVRAGLTGRPGDWKWSSYRTYMGAAQDDIVDTKKILSIFDKKVSVARKKFAEFVHDGINMKSKEEFYPPDTFPYLGDTEFVKDLSKKYGEIRRWDKIRVRITLEKLAGKISGKTGIDIAEMQASYKSKNISSARKMFSVIAVYYAGYKATQVAKYLNCSISAISRYLRDARMIISNQKTVEKIVEDVLQGIDEIV